MKLDLSIIENCLQEISDSLCELNQNIEKLTTNEHGALKCHVEGYIHEMPPLNMGSNIGIVMSKDV